MGNPFLGIALGGGGARGAAHVGVLQVLDKSSIKIDSISGVSAGAIVGAMYAYSMDAQWVEKKFRDVISSNIFKKILSKADFNKDSSSIILGRMKRIFYQHIRAIASLHKNSFIDIALLREILTLLIPVNTFDQMQIPLKIISTDLKSGQNIINEKGDLIDALIQSCAIPGIFRPISRNNQLIVDGGIGMPIPILPLKEECDFTIGVDIGIYEFQDLDYWNISTIKQRSSIITSNVLKKQLVSKADFVISPDTMGLKWSNFNYGETLLNNGKLAAEKNISILKQMIRDKKNIINSLKNS